MNSEFDTAIDAWRNHGVAPVDLSTRISSAVVADYRFRKNVKTMVRVSASALAITAIAFSIWYYGRPNERILASSQPIIDPFRESTKFMTSVSQSMKFETPSLPASDSFRLEATTFLSSAQTERLQTIPETARNSIEPVTKPASQAMNRFVKDFGAAFSLPKPKM